jgi:hypothetical protein
MRIILKIGGTGRYMKVGKSIMEILCLTLMKLFGYTHQMGQKPKQSYMNCDLEIDGQGIVAQDVNFVVEPKWI